MPNPQLLISLSPHIVNVPSNPVFLMGATSQGTKCQEYFPVAMTFKNGLIHYQTPWKGAGGVRRNEQCPVLHTVDNCRRV